MVTEGSPNFDDVLHGILEVTEAAPQTPDVYKAQGVSIERMVRQAHALLRQQLERKGKLEPALYSRKRMEHVLQEFEAVLPDIQASIAARVDDSVSEIVRQEVRRVLQDALDDLQEAMTVPVSAEDMEEVPSPHSPPLPLTEETEQFVEKPPGVQQEGETKATQKQVWSPSDTPSKAPTQPTVMGRSSSPEPPSVSAQQEHAGSGESSDVGSGIRQDDREIPDETLYEGSVKLSVECQGGAREVIQFLNRIGSKPELRVMQLVGTHGSIAVWLTLRRPLPLKKLLLETEGVSKVSTRNRSQGSQEVFEVVLKKDLPIATGD